MPPLTIFVLVLIETLWNVKLVDGPFGSLIERSINRNIVECKEKYKVHLPWLLLCINRNIVECKVE